MVGELYAEDGPRCRSESFPIGKAQIKIDSSLWHSRAEELRPSRYWIPLALIHSEAFTKYTPLTPASLNRFAIVCWICSRFSSRNCRCSSVKSSPSKVKMVSGRPSGFGLLILKPLNQDFLFGRPGTNRVADPRAAIQWFPHYFPVWTPLLLLRPSNAARLRRFSKRRGLFGKTPPAPTLGNPRTLPCPGRRR